jgi:alpha-beta hydrolase superfamily lysophospholipase
MFGHSMGSMIARDFSTKYGNELAGAIYCGTTGIFLNTHEVKAKLDVAIADGKAHESDPAYVAELMGWMFVRCEEGATLGNEWICSDPYVQRDHAEDPFDAFTHPTHNISLRDFIDMMLIIEGEEWAAKVPTSLPVLCIAGDQDPVGNFGEGVYSCANWLTATGHDVETKLYTGYRHEIHNYDSLKFDVEETIIECMLGQL